MLAMPLVIGSVAAGRPSLASILIPPAMVLLFLARYAALPTATRLIKGRHLPHGHARRRFAWSAIYLAASASLLSTAVFLAAPSWRAPLVTLSAVTGLLGGTQAVLALLSLDRSLWGESIGLAGLACSAPLVMAAAGHPADGPAWTVAALCFGYFSSSLAYVRTYRARKDGAGLTAVAACVAVHLGVLTAMIVLWWKGWLPTGGLLAWAPVLARTAWGLLRPPASLRGVGWTEMGVAMVFLSIAVVAYAT